MCVCVLAVIGKPLSPPAGTQAIPSRIRQVVTHSFLSYAAVIAGPLSCALCVEDSAI